jgi:hypothetical protein
MNNSNYYYSINLKLINMKKINFTFSLLLLSLFGFGQFTVETEVIRARVEQDGLLFNNGQNFEGAFEAPINSGLSTFYSYNFWVSGLLDGTPYFYGTKFLQLSDGKRYGPIMNPEFYDTEPEIWDRVWHLTREEIDFHIENYNDPGYEMPEVIENWPAQGDVSKGQAAYLAPFIDANSNGNYEPELGDYPEVLGDETIYVIYNGERNNDVPEKMGIETHVMAYVFNCEDFIASSAVFTYVKHINRSGNDYENTYLGFFSDFDIGDPADDMARTDVERSTVYGINGDSFDESSFAGPGYGEYLPAQGVTILRGVKQDDDGIDNNVGIAENESVNGMGYGDGISDNEYRGLDFSLMVRNSGGPTGDPSIAIQFYNSMQGVWRDLNPQTYGGNGYNSSSVLSRYSYSENDPLNYGTHGVGTDSLEWGDPLPSDIRMIGSSGPFTFESGTSRDMYLAYTFAREGIGSDTSIAFMKSYIDEYLMYYQSGLEFCGSPIYLGISDQKPGKTSISVYPNPFTNEISFNYKGNDPNAFVTIYNMMGQEVFNQQAINGLNTLNLDRVSGSAFILKLSDNKSISTQKIIRKP